jgi:hypothetical protein
MNYQTMYSQKNGRLLKILVHYLGYRKSRYFNFRSNFRLVLQALLHFLGTMHTCTRFPPHSYTFLYALLRVRPPSDECPVNNSYDSIFK